MSDKILIVGAGAIGGFYGGLLAKAGAKVSVVCRSDYNIVKQRGYRIDSCDLGQWQFEPEQVLQRAGDYRQDADYLILCTKVTDQIDRIGLIRDAVRPHTAIVFIQNGVEIEAQLQDAFPDNELVSGLAFVCCNRLQAGEIRHLAYGKLMLGNLPGGVSAKTRHLQQLFIRSGIECPINEDIIAGRWQKCVWNAPFNPLSVLSGGLPTLAILQQQEQLIRRIMQEVCDIAAGCGHPLTDDVIETNIQNTYAMPPYKTSMLLDFERGHPMETEAILGNAVRAAHRQGVACPRLETLYSLMKLRALQIQNQSQ
ncbi:ketopantoate reductase family protein [Methylomonas methanica]|uniref:2-dehydropantoate 2-reductase n=1 Tax=Methylomonas methanica (strain DSM 25384 / MC09) TaxID=857087 RepID=F9ZXW2_METMM|nr:2-dehydropantoate 2-reductase [Methylomonas methanica]AEF98541.1 2-dehydropantoate 2-reductase [Methylomonas methanica MC09]